MLTAMLPFVSLMGEGLQGVLNGTAGAAETFAEGVSGVVEVLMDMNSLFWTLPLLQMPLMFGDGM